MERAAANGALTWPRRSASCSTSPRPARVVSTRILAISGSLRRESHNSLLLRLAQEHAPGHVEIVIWDGLADVPAYNEDHEHDPGAAVVGLRTAIVDADALLIATPEYNFGVPGALKNALDWASRPYGASALSGVPDVHHRRQPVVVRRRAVARRPAPGARPQRRVRRRGDGRVRAERLTTERDAVIAEVSDVVSALAARIGVPLSVRRRRIQADPACETPAMSILGLDHAGVTVAEPRSLARVLRGAAGAPGGGHPLVESTEIEAIVGHPGARLRIADLALPGGGVLELIQYEQPAAPPVRPATRGGHGAHRPQVPNLARCPRRLVAAGVDLISARPVTIAGAASSRLVVLYLRDPDGNVIELIERPASSSGPDRRKPGSGFRARRRTEMGARLAAARDADGVLAALAEAVHDVLGMTVAVNVRRPADDRFEVTLVIGGGEEAAALVGEEYGAETFLVVCDPAYQRPDGIYLVPADSPFWDAFEGRVVIEQEEVLDVPDAWRPGDMLDLALRDRQGEIMAVVAADDPADGRVPRRSSSRSSRCSPHTPRPRSRRRSPPATPPTASARPRSCSTCRCPSPPAWTRRRSWAAPPRAWPARAAGHSSRSACSSTTAGCCGAWPERARAAAPAGRTMPLELAQRAMIAEHRVSESYLLPIGAIARYVAEPAPLERNGAGARGWRRHTLLLPLATGAGEMLGFVWVDDPLDRQLPSMDAVRRMELFVRQAACSCRARGCWPTPASRPRATRSPGSRTAALRGRADRRRRRLLARAARRRPLQAGQRPVGPLRGDELLRLLAEQLSSRLPKAARAFRLGGDEFAVLSPTMAPTGLARSVAAVRRGVDGRIDFSAGIAAAPTDAAVGPPLVHAADEALRAAKRGRPRPDRALPRPPERRHQAGRPVARAGARGAARPARRARCSTPCWTASRRRSPQPAAATTPTTCRAT